MAQARLQPLVLKPRQARSSPQERWVAVLFAIALFWALVWVAYTLLGNPGDADYWGQFKIGTTHRFELRKGGLGFYQVNMQPVHVKMREYFIGRK